MKKRKHTDRPPAYQARTQKPAVDRTVSHLRTELSPAARNAIPIVTVKNRISQTAVYRRQIGSVENAQSGDLVAVYSKTNQLLGYGLYNARSELAIRMMWRGRELPTDAAWFERLDQAVDLRQRILQLDRHTDTYRIVHAEADGLPGLMIDRFGDVLSAEAFSVGMLQRAHLLLNHLHQKLGTTHSIVQTSPQFEAQEGASAHSSASEGCPSSVVVQEYGTRFKVRFEGGHKTGFFCDQRENRKMLADFCEDQSVLDLCCYTGGFAVQAMTLGRAKEVVGVDLDEAPLQVAKENANLNQVRARFVQSDAFNYMRDMLQAGRQFDVVVLDPPKLIRNRSEIEDGTRKHFDLNRLAMRLVRPGGLLLSCTCSGLLQETEFIKLLCSAARQAGPEVSPATAERSARHAPRDMQFLARTGAAPCHPVGGNDPETDYLNAAWMVLR
jgi:23S rRNA (cytosine1962-C5)-methyltransferase